MIILFLYQVVNYKGQHILYRHNQKLLSTSRCLLLSVFVCYVFVNLLYVCTVRTVCLYVCLCVCLMWQALMQAHDTVAGQELAEEDVAQYLGETVKLVRLQKARDTPLVRHHVLVFLSHCYYLLLLL